MRIPFRGSIQKLTKPPNPPAATEANRTLALVPPNPKLLQVAARGPPAGSCAGCPRTSRGSSPSGSGWSRLHVAGARRLCSARMVKADSTAPAAPSKCPVAPFVELTCTRCTPSAPNTCTAQHRQGSCHPASRPMWLKTPSTAHHALHITPSAPLLLVHL